MTNVAVVDVARLLDESEPGRQAAETLKSAWQQRRAQYERAAKDLGAAADDPSSPGARELAMMDAEAQDELGAMRARMAGQLLEKSRALLDAICKEKNIDIVVNAATVLHLPNASLDLTDELIRRVDRERIKVSAS